jgi:hypothetical protein
MVGLVDIPWLIMAQEQAKIKTLNTKNVLTIFFMFHPFSSNNNEPVWNLIYHLKFKKSILKKYLVI